VLTVACASPEKMAKLAENVKVECQPAVLEVVAGTIDATVNVIYPKDYFNPNVVVEVTPVIVYQGGEAAMKPFKYQGEKVRNNYKVVSKDGQKVSEKIHFDYVEGMEKCYLELRGKVIAGTKSINLPTKKVADGANTTYMLVKNAGNVSFKADNYQEVISSTTEGQIKYLVNSSEVRGSELKGNSVKEFLAALDKIAQDERTTVKSTEIVAYASPEGAIDKNNKLSDNRSKSATKAWDKVTKGHEAADPTVRSVGEDWEGFQQLVSQSNLEDKDLILRVLSMYSDPAVRENEIRNMSQVYTALKGEVLPELRRARLIANVEFKNYTNEELLDLLENNESLLDEEALLRVASLVRKPAQKEEIFKKAINKFGSERAKFNLAALYLLQGKDEKARAGFNELNANDPDVINAKGVLALHNQDYKAAEAAFRKAGTDDAKANLGIVLIETGRYEEAAQVLKDVDGCCNNTVLAYILTDQLDKAKATVHCKDPRVHYLKAIISAREGDAAGVKANLENAFKNKAFKERAATDIEFAGYTL
jgi:tetratricopeptide (TPR) repeat protein/archaellum component FlaG (FlaF/FlaG flagellin family)